MVAVAGDFMAKGADRRLGHPPPLDEGQSQTVRMYLSDLYRFEALTEVLGKSQAQLLHEFIDDQLSEHCAQNKELVDKIMSNKRKERELKAESKALAAEAKRRADEKKRPGG